MRFWENLPQQRLLVDVSLWSANLAQLGTEIERMELYADLFHIDVADAHFVPGLLFFPDLVATLRPFTRKPFHVHLMTERPLTLIEAFVEAGADLITVHYENGNAVPTVIEAIQASNCAVGVALDLDTPPAAVAPYLHQIDLVLLMGTRLGVKGQDLAPTACERIQAVRRLIHRYGRADAVKIGADGGIRRHTVPQLRAAGVDSIVPGSLVFGAPDVAQTFTWLHELPEPGSLA